ncbi:MAG: M1 family peptidase, partial [Flavobacteriaceae bacterium]|nr:M1 family peptidase [Flavobacteriaceae bacterium]
MKYKVVVWLLLFTALGYSQTFTKRDSIFGSITPERAWWDLKHYDLNVSVFPDDRKITGTNTITYTVIDEAKELQLDLQRPMTLLNVTQKGKELEVRSEGMFYYIRLKEKQKIGETYALSVQFSGTPVVAIRPPWDGGFTWEKDSNGKHFIAN